MSRDPEVILREVEEVHQKLRALQDELDKAEKNKEANELLMKIVERWDFFDTNRKKQFKSPMALKISGVKDDLNGLVQSHEEGETTIVSIKVKCADGRIVAFENNSKGCIELMQERERALCLSMLSQKCPACKSKGQRLYKKTHSVGCGHCFPDYRVNEEVILHESDNVIDVLNVIELLEKGPYEYLRKVRDSIPRKATFPKK